MARNTFANLIVVRKVDDRAGSIVTAEEALLRRQHLQLLLFAARTAVARHDDTAYRTALAGARQWLGDFFELSSPAAQALLEQIQALEPIDIDPQLPDISGIVASAAPDAARAPRVRNEDAAMRGGLYIAAAADPRRAARQPAARRSGLRRAALRRSTDRDVGGDFRCCCWSPRTSSCALVDSRHQRATARGDATRKQRRLERARRSLGQGLLELSEGD